jgi:hypothetical protein
MVIIIGAATTVESDIWPLMDGLISVNYSFTPGIQRLWQLGSFSPFDTFIPYVTSLSITAYGRRIDNTGGSIQVPIPPATDCSEASFHTMVINPATCVVSSSTIQDEFFVTSYGYDKPAFGYGIESWSFTTRPVYSDVQQRRTAVMLRGTAEGTMSVGQGFIEDEQFVGIVIDNNASNFRLNPTVPITSVQGSVQAGNSSFGVQDTTRHIIVTQIGNSMGLNDEINGLSGKVAITIPVNPIYL